MRDTDWRPSLCPTCGKMRPAAEHPVCDNCDLTPMGSVSLVKQQRQDVVKQVTRGLTDDELLLELRRRGRIGRIEANEVVGSHHVKQGMRVDYQVGAVLTRIAHELLSLHRKGHRMPGFKVESGNFLSFLSGGDGHGGDRRVTVVLNYVKEKD